MIDIKSLSICLSKTIKLLDFGHNDISDEGISFLAQNLPTTLESLSLDYTDISDEGISFLAQNLPTTLESLSLAYTEYRRSWLRTIRTVLYHLILAYLDIRFNDCISETIIQKFRERHHSHRMSFNHIECLSGNHP